MADERAPVETSVEEMREIQTMSREAVEKIKINFVKCSDIRVYDQMGNKIRFGDLYEKQKTIIVLTRHLLDFVCQEYVEDLGSVPEEYLQAADVKIVVIAPSPVRFIEEFKRNTSYRYSLYCDPDYELFNAVGCKQQLMLGKTSHLMFVLNGPKSKHIKSSIMMGMLRTTWRAFKEEATKRPGDVKQQGASFIIGPGEQLHHSHLDLSMTDHSNINDLLTIAGVQNVSFPKDQRVLEI